MPREGPGSFPGGPGLLEEIRVNFVLEYDRWEKYGTKYLLKILFLFLSDE